MSIWTLTALLLPGQSPASSLPWRLARDDNGALVLLSPAKTIHEHLDPFYPWEGGTSYFECWYSGPDLVLYLHRDWANTPYWFDLRLTQHSDGTITVAWWSTGNPCDVCFVHYASFRDSWRDPRVWRALEPALRELEQYIPDMETAWAMMEWGL